MRKTLTGQRWKGAARKVKVRLASLRAGFVFKCFFIWLVYIVRFFYITLPIIIFILCITPENFLYLFFERRNIIFIPVTYKNSAIASMSHVFFLWTNKRNHCIVIHANRDTKLKVVAFFQNLNDAPLDRRHICHDFLQMTFPLCHI